MDFPPLNVLVFVGYRRISARYVAKWGIAQMCLCETKYQGGGIAPYWGSADVPEKVSRDMLYRSDTIAISREMGPFVMPLTVLYLSGSTVIFVFTLSPAILKKVK